MRVESATRKTNCRVTIRGSHQRLFCGFDPHCFATGYFPLVPLRFGGVIHHPRRSTCRRVPASCRASRIPLSAPYLFLSLSLSFLSLACVPPIRGGRQSFPSGLLLRFFSKVSSQVLLVDDTAFRFYLSSYFSYFLIGNEEEFRKLLHHKNYLLCFSAISFIRVFFVHTEFTVFLSFKLISTIFCDIHFFIV